MRVHHIHLCCCNKGVHQNSLRAARLTVEFPSPKHLLNFHALKPRVEPLRVATFVIKGAHRPLALHNRHSIAPTEPHFRVEFRSSAVATELSIAASFLVFLAYNVYPSSASSYEFHSSKSPEPGQPRLPYAPLPPLTPAHSTLAPTPPTARWSQSTAPPAT